MFASYCIGPMAYAVTYVCMKAYMKLKARLLTEMSTVLSSEDAEDSMSVSDVTVQNAAQTNPYTEGFDDGDIESDELDRYQVYLFIHLVSDVRRSRGDERVRTPP